MALLKDKPAHYSPQRRTTKKKTRKAKTGAKGPKSGHVNGIRGRSSVKVHVAVTKRERRREVGSPHTTMSHKCSGMLGNIDSFAMCFCHELVEYALASSHYDLKAYDLRSKLKLISKHLSS